MVYTMDQCSAFAAAKEAGEVLEIDEELWYWFLEVLPPIHMNYYATVKNPDGSTRQQRASFGFAEGYELVTAFWKQNGQYYAQLTTEVNPHA